MKKNKKPVYETPALIPLGELAKGLGVACNPVGSAPSGQCGGGTQVPPQVPCTKGGQALVSCGKGGRYKGP
jgi:hypothetical protein